MACISAKVADSRPALCEAPSWDLEGIPVLLLSIITLFIGPLLYLWLRKGGLVAKAFDSIIVAALVVRSEEHTSELQSH